MARDQRARHLRDPSCLQGLSGPMQCRMQAVPGGALAIVPQLPTGRTECELDHRLLVVYQSRSYKNDSGYISGLVCLLLH
jgi:hypothetical protein